MCLDPVLERQQSFLFQIWFLWRRRQTCQTSWGTGTGKELRRVWCCTCNVTQPVPPDWKNILLRDDDSTHKAWSLCPYLARQVKCPCFQPPSNPHPTVQNLASTTSAFLFCFCGSVLDVFCLFFVFLFCPPLPMMMQKLVGRRFLMHTRSIISCLFRVHDLSPHHSTRRH